MVALSPATMHAVGSELGHRGDAALGNEVTGVLDELGALEHRSDLGTILEVLEHLVHRGRCPWP